MDLIEFGKQVEDRKKWNRTIAQFDDGPKCSECNGPLETVTDYINGIEYICKNPDCESNN